MITICASLIVLVLLIGGMRTISRQADIHIPVIDDLPWVDYMVCDGCGNVRWCDAETHLCKECE
jgi:hypothetical protein